MTSPQQEQTREIALAYGRGRISAAEAKERLKKIRPAWSEEKTDAWLDGVAAATWE